ncbi:MAG: 3-isopropylmalate dehydratase small subunit [Castellaniella sp.]|uniref:3-isopropylmalate dehydratase small subunit n=1 Tax=Castellaniella sp. TaxID=1955812 RepID=UPI003C76CDE6
METSIRIIRGRGLSLPGNDVDTDQIIESRYLKVTSFYGIEAHLFESVRSQARAEGVVYPLDDPRFQGACILVVGRNFGCGSSREHAPQALQRYGFKAIVGESFGEIFASNCLTIGLSCIPVTAADQAELVQAIHLDPMAELCIDIAAGTLVVAGREIEFSLPEGRRRRLLDGSWSSLDVLLKNRATVDAWLRRAPDRRWRSVRPSDQQIQHPSFDGKRSGEVLKQRK